MIMVSPTGSRLAKPDHPAVPVTIPDILEATVDCARAGATALHLHVRDSMGRHSLDAGLYAEALSELDAALPGFPVQVTTESAGIYDTAAQSALLERLQPRWVSISLREAARSRANARRMYDFCKSTGIAIQHILYDTQDARTLREWQRLGVLGREESVILVLGRYGQDAPAGASALETRLAELPPVGRWMVCAFGPLEHACLARAARLGGDIRVGFENSIVGEDGTRWPSNAASVRALCKRLALVPC